MKRLRHQTLAGAVLTGDEHVGIRWGHPRDHLKHGTHSGRLSDEIWRTTPEQLVSRFKPAPFPERPSQLDLRPHNC